MHFVKLTSWHISKLKFVLIKLPQVQIRSLKVILKKSNPDEWRLIMNVLSPQGASNNDGIGPELCLVKYFCWHAGLQLWGGTPFNLAKMMFRKHTGSSQLTVLIGTYWTYLGLHQCHPPIWPSKCTNDFLSSHRHGGMNTLLRRCIVAGPLHWRYYNHGPSKVRWMHKEQTHNTICRRAPWPQVCWANILPRMSWHWGWLRGYGTKAPSC